MRVCESENGTGSVNEKYSVHLHRHLDLQQNLRTLFDYDTWQKYSDCGTGSGCVQMTTFFSLVLQRMTLHSLNHQVFLQGYPVVGFDEVGALPSPQGFLVLEDVGG